MLVELTAVWDHLLIGGDPGINADCNAGVLVRVDKGGDPHLPAVQLVHQVCSVCTGSLVWLT